MSNTSTTPSSSDLATFIYSNFIIDHLKSKSNLELNLHKNLFRKFFYPQLISFLDKALSPSRNHINHLILLFPLRFVFLDLNKLKFKMDLFNSKLDLGLDLDYDKEDQKETKFQ